MGKRAKKKVVQGASPASKGSRSSPSSSKSTASSSTMSPPESGRFVDNGGASVENSSTRCPHGPNVEKLRTQLAKSTGIHCQDCTKLRSAVSAGKEQRKGGKGSKLVRKKQLPPSSGLGDEKKSNHNLWICLFCGQLGCGEGNVKIAGERSKHEVKQGVVGRGHAWQHWLQLKHPLVMLCGEEFSCWCFSCEVAHDVREVKHDQDMVPESENPSSPENEEEVSLPPSRDVLLQQAATLIREKLAEQLAVVTEDSKDPTHGFDDEEKLPSPRGLENSVVQENPEVPINTDARVMKGLVNLGNTCFFNSVMQNLLSVEMLRRHFGPGSSLPEGALTYALRKFFLEASFHSPPETNGQLPEAGLKKNAKGARGGWSSIDGTYNPKGLFGAICSKAPRFKGFQQHDSHELLRCLLDGLHTEEENILQASLKSKVGAGEDALRALSESDARENGSNTEVDDMEDSGSAREDSEGTAEKGVVKQKTGARQETFVERAFGGQLSSTVSCCECGHSSVVYESFLDLSLPIPSNKPPSKNASALANGSSFTQSRTQKPQGVKSSKAKAKADSDLEAFRPMPAGLGTPLLLLPAPPPKENNCYSGITGTESNLDWMDYIDPGTGSGEADWLDFLSDDGEVDSGVIIGCAPNPEFQTLQDSAPSPESEIVFGCAPNPNWMQHSAVIRIASEGKGILSPPADGSPFSMEFEERGSCEGVDLFSLPNGKVLSHGLDANFGESVVLLEAAKEAIAESKNSIVGCGSGLRPLRGQEMDMPVQMRGGSEPHTFDATQEAELDSSPVSEPLNGNNVCIEHSGDCNDGTSTQSDIICGPNGSTVILLGPPVDNGSASEFLNVELEGDYDGVGSLFEEEDSSEDRVYGPLPFNHSGADFQESAYDGTIFDDVLDLSKISSDGRGEWLVSNEEGQGEENAETSMSLEGCLQTFTRSELLSGENAWACENCTKKYHDGLAKEEKLTPVPEKPSMKSSVTNDGSGYCSNGSSKDPSIGDSISCDGHEYRELGSNGCSSRKGSDFDNSQETASSSNVEIAELEPFVSIEMNGDVEGEENSAAPDERVLACQEGQADSAERVGSTSSQSSFEPVDLHGAVIRSEVNAEINSSDVARTLLGPEVPNCSGGGGGEEVGDDKRETEKNASQIEKKMGQVSTRNSVKTSKLKKSKSKKVQEEKNKVIKQDATKRFLISRAPPVLTVQLKRFAQDMRGRLSKLSGHISFQELLDLHPFLDHRYVNVDCKYRLIGTVEHSGTLKSGHYVAFVRGPPAQNSRNDTLSTSDGASSWFYISDSHVHQTNLAAVLQSEAYLVFYERVDTTGVSHSK